MSKWSDYAISAVRYNSARTHVERVRTHPDNGDTIGASVEHTRTGTVGAIKNGKTFVTIFKDAEGKWKRGQSVYVFKVNGLEFMKTVDNGDAADYLENLPEL